MGYGGVSNSVAIEFDTYKSSRYGLGNNDGNSSNHVAIDINSSLTNTALANVYGSCGFTARIHCAAIFGLAVVGFEGWNKLAT